MNKTYESSRRLLLISFHFPPILGSSGFLRPLSWAKYLPKNGIDVDVVTVKPFAYPEYSKENLSQLNKDFEVKRTFAIDAQRHLSIRGRFLGFTAFPDRWVSWLVSAVPTVLYRLFVRKYDFIATTYPIATAHLTGLICKKLSGKKWLADFRDPMVLDQHPSAGRLRNFHVWMERQVLKHADLITVTTPGTKRLFVSRYGALAAAKVHVVENGVDLSILNYFEDSQEPSPRGPSLRGLHNGLVYALDRNPENLIKALGEILEPTTEIAFRASGLEHEIASMATESGVGEKVHCLSALPHADAIRAMKGCDFLILLQGEPCNDQIPAKVYEYMLAEKPILALTDPEGDTGRLLAGLGVKYLAKLENLEDVQKALTELLRDLSLGQAHVIPLQTARQFSRSERAGELAQLLQTS